MSDYIFLNTRVRFRSLFVVFSPPYKKKMPRTTSNSSTSWYPSPSLSSLIISHAVAVVVVVAGFLGYIL